MKKKWSKSESIISNDVEYALARLLTRELEMHRWLEAMREELGSTYGMNYAQSFFYLYPKHGDYDYLTDKNLKVFLKKKAKL